MVLQNKAHTATVRRIAKRYSAHANASGQPDITNGKLTVEVETSATLSHGIKALLEMEGPVFVAVTNRESLPDALRLASNTRVGVMDPGGEIIKQSVPSYAVTDSIGASANFKL